MKQYHKKQITNQDLFEELQKIKKILGIILDKEGIRKSDLDNFKSLKIEADKKALLEFNKTMLKINYPDK